MSADEKSGVFRPFRRRIVTPYFDYATSQNITYWPAAVKRPWRNVDIAVDSYCNFRLLN